ncbi:restriction endonuclease subunit S [Micromonospora echinospora]|uniref:restriction endonuclease subunit S n=1 Tax=Micromonospora echinospora TaxID=1877 RepID=UPI0034338B92
MTARLTQSARWPVDKLGRWTTITNGSTPRRDDERYWVGGRFPWLNSAVVNRESVTTADQFVTATAMSECHLPVVEPGSLVVALTGQGKTRGMATIVQIRCTINQHLACIAPSSTHWDSRYLLWSLRSAYQKLRATSDETGATKGGLTIEALQRHLLPMPPLGEQRRIADFLDYETSRIDALIAKQEQLIETLRERRQAVLDTEFEAVGAKRVQLRRGIRFLTSGSRGWGDYYADEGERFLRIGNLPRTNLVLRGDVQYIQLPPGVTEGSRTRLRGDDLLFSITAYLGSVAVVTDEWIGAYVSQHVALCRLDPSMFNSKVVGYFMLTTEGQDQLKLGAAGGTKLQLALDDIKALSVPLVPLDTQGKIVASIEVQMSRIDALIAKAEELIGLARERRVALITEAVTGRIDVSTGKAREGVWADGGCDA